jgi:hypothetical protein
MKTRIIVGLVVLTVSLWPVVSQAADCKKIIAKAGIAEYIVGPCSYGGVDYVWCLDTPVTGNLKSTWHIFANPDFNAWELTVPSGIPGIPVWDLWATWNLSVFETKKGDIITQANEIAHLDVYFTYGAISGTALITGGTGDFEGATGWIGWVVTESGGGELRGEVCTP